MVLEAKVPAVKRMYLSFTPWEVAASQGTFVKVPPDRIGILLFSPSKKIPFRKVLEGLFQ